MTGFPSIFLGLFDYGASVSLSKCCRYEKTKQASQCTCSHETLSQMGGGKKYANRIISNIVKWIKSTLFLW